MSESRDRILGTAAELHASDGLDAVSMRAVASRLGVTAMSLYRHFHNKEELIEAISESGFSLLVTYLKRPTRKRSKPLAMIEHFLAFALDEPRLYELMFLRRRGAQRTFPRDFAAHRSPTFDLLRVAVEGEMKAGRMRRDDALETALTIWTHAHGLISMYTLGRFGDDADAFRALYARSMRRLFKGIEGVRR
ncbi:MAG TPA: TetR/AcrR family transcriptional regulator [Thermoanaerobaculia bacterium]|nr:TetR/AcrR family transcriptional regulator [Thermoanaerobaculia bacterium]